MLNESEPSQTRCKKNIHVLEKAECLVCKSGTYISVVHKGNGHLNTHLQSEKHRKAVRGAVVSTKMTSYFVTAGSNCEDEITAAEGTLAFHAVKHHHSFLSMSLFAMFCRRISSPMMKTNVKNNDKNKYIAVYVADYTDDACLGEIDLEYNKYIAEGRLIRICP